MRSAESRRLLAARIVVAVTLILIVASSAKLASWIRRSRGATAPTADTPARDSAERGRPPEFAVPDSMFGRSRTLRFRTLTPAAAVALPGFIGMYGEEAIHEPAMHIVSARGSGAAFALIVLRPFGQKRGDYLGRYRLGQWPSERWLMARNYWNPDGLIEVTPSDTTLQLSAHFALGTFLTQDRQEGVWPKYVLVREELIDKLELVLADLAAHGVATGRVEVLSGFRAPYYNERLVNEGSARASRHQYGDAADIIIDANGDGQMDDLNGDRRIDLRDTEVILRAVERVEAAYPALVGGLGLYHAMGPRGPFAHVDVRGTSARWRRGGPPRR